MTASVNGLMEAGVSVDNGQNLIDRMVGSTNVSSILIQNQHVDALIDSGSMVTTISESGYNNLKVKPTLNNLDQLGLEISVADGSSLKYMGYIECSLTLPFLTKSSYDIPVLVVPDTDFNYKCPVIVGTNVLRLCKESCMIETDTIPTEWKTAIDSIQCKLYSVKSDSKKPITIGPYETTILNGRSRRIGSNIENVVTEACDNSTYIVCPRVIKIGQRSQAKIPVKVCNMTAKPIVIKPKAVICNINSVKVVDNLTSPSVTGSTKSESGSKLPNDLGIKIESSNLTEEQRSKVHQLLGNWEHIFSKGPLDLGLTNLVEHKIVLNDDVPFKQPYRRIPPNMYEEVRQHIKEMLETGVIRDSESPYSSNIVLVRKRDGSLRFCIDQ